MVYANQQAYYDAIAESSRRGNSGPFIDFMLGEILLTLKSHQGEVLDVGENVGENERKILSIIAHTPPSIGARNGGSIGYNTPSMRTHPGFVEGEGIDCSCGSC